MYPGCGQKHFKRSLRFIKLSIFLWERPDDGLMVPSVKGKLISAKDLSKAMSRQLKRESQKLKEQFNKERKKIESSAKSAAESAKRKGKKTLQKGVNSVRAIHPVVDKLLEGMTCPHNRQRPPIGLPTFPNFDSDKSRGFADITVTTGTAGAGAVGFNPVIANDQPTVIYSSNASTYSGTTIPSMNGAAGGTSTADLANLPYTSAQVNAGSGTGVEGRVVTYGIEFESTTATLYEQGIAQFYVDPAHTSISNYTSGQLSSHRECLTIPLVKGHKHYIEIVHASPTETAYGTGQLPFNSSSSACIAGMLITGASATNPVTVLMRITSDVEYVGLLAESHCTPNPMGPPDALNHCIELAQKVYKHKQANHHPLLRPAHMHDLAKKAYREVTKLGGGKNVVKDAFGASLFLA